MLVKITQSELTEGDFAALPYWWAKGAVGVVIKRNDYLAFKGIPTFGENGEEYIDALSIIIIWPDVLSNTNVLIDINNSYVDWDTYIPVKELDTILMLYPETKDIYYYLRGLNKV